MFDLVFYSGYGYDIYVNLIISFEKLLCVGFGMLSVLGRFRCEIL